MTRGTILFVSLWLAASPINASATAPDIVKDTGVRGGLVVVVGCDDPDLLIGLGKQQGYVVHGLDTRSDRIAAATAALRDKGFLGKVSAARFDGRSLPYVDNLVNLWVVRDARCGIRHDEMMRVLAPGGVAMIATFHWPTDASCVWVPTWHKNHKEALRADEGQAKLRIRRGRMDLHGRVRLADVRQRR